MVTQYAAKAVFFMAISLSPTALYCQNSIISSGGVASGPDGSVMFAIGQTAFNSFSGVGGTLSEGLHHPLEASVITSIADNEGIELAVHVYPNPTTHGLILTTHNIGRSVTYALYDFNGRILMEEAVAEIELFIPMSDYASGEYILKVTSGFRQVKIFRVIKK